MQNINKFLSYLTIGSLIVITGCGDNSLSALDDDNISNFNETNITTEQSIDGRFFSYVTKHNEIIKTEQRLAIEHWDVSQAPTFDLSTFDVLVYQLPKTGSGGCRIVDIISHKEYDEYVAMTSVAHKAINSYCQDVAIPHYAWTQIPKTNKPIMFNESLYVDDARDENESRYLQPAQAIDFEVVSEGEIETTQSYGKWYEIVGSQERLETIYSILNLSFSEMPAIDFTKESIVFLAMGSTTQRQNSLKIQNVTGNDMNWTSPIFIDIENSIVNSNCSNDGTLYLPYQIVKVSVPPKTLYSEEENGYDALFIDSIKTIGCP